MTTVPVRADALVSTRETVTGEAEKIGRPGAGLSAKNDIQPGNVRGARELGHQIGVVNTKVGSELLATEWLLAEVVPGLGAQGKRVARAEDGSFAAARRAHTDMDNDMEPTLVSPAGQDCRDGSTDSDSNVDEEKP